MKNVYYVCLLILSNLNIQYCSSFHLNKSPKTTSHSFMNVHSKRIIFMSLSNSNPNNINDENAYKNSDPIVNSKSNAMTFSGNGDNQNINQNSDTFYPFPQYPGVHRRLSPDLPRPFPPCRSSVPRRRSVNHYLVCGLNGIWT